MYRMASTTSRRSVFTGRPPPGGVGKCGSISAHWASVTSLGYDCVLMSHSTHHHHLMGQSVSHVPQPDRLVLTTRGERPAVRAEHHGSYAAGMPCEGGLLLAR